MKHVKHKYLISLLSVIALLASSAWSNAEAITFTPRADNSAPRTTTGGASRGNLFMPNKGNGAPKQASTGASRGNLFTPQGTPKQASSGASRGNLFTPANSNGTPQQAIGGASRVGNYYLNPSTVAATATGPAALIGVMPQSYYGTTISERPTVMVYIPTSDAKEAVFSIKDEAGNTQHQMTIPVAGKSGVIAIRLPTDARPLAVGKNYQWFLALKLDGQLSPSSPYIDGWIKRIQPSAELVTAMQQQHEIKRAEALGKNGVWYDCVATLAALYATQPTNPTLIKEWKELLSSVSLKEIATAPLVASVH